MTTPEEGMMIVQLNCGRLGRRMTQGLEGIHGKVGQVRVNQSWEVELASTFGVNVQPGRYFVQRVGIVGGVIPLRHNLSEKIQDLRSEFKSRNKTRYVVHLGEWAMVDAEPERASTSRVNVMVNSKVNVNVEVNNRQGGGSGGTATPNPALDPSSPVVRRTSRVTGNWREASRKLCAGGKHGVAGNLKKAAAAAATAFLNRSSNTGSPEVTPGGSPVNNQKRQKISVHRAPDGKFQVKGLLVGQSVRQSANGNVHLSGPAIRGSIQIFDAGQLQSSATSSATLTSKSTPVSASAPLQPRQFVRKVGNRGEGEGEALNRTVIEVVSVPTPAAASGAAVRERSLSPEYNMTNRSRPRHRQRLRSVSKRRGFFRNFPLAGNELQLSVLPAEAAAGAAVAGNRGDGSGRGRAGRGRGRGRPMKVNEHPVNPAKRSVFQRVFKQGQLEVEGQGRNDGDVDMGGANTQGDLEVTTSSSKKVAVPNASKKGTVGGGVGAAKKGVGKEERVLKVNLGSPVVILGGNGEVADAVSAPVRPSDLITGFKLRARRNFSNNQVAQARAELSRLKSASFQGSREFANWTLVAPTASSIIRDLLGV